VAKKQVKQGNEFRNIILTALGLGAALLIYWSIQRPRPPLPSSSAAEQPATAAEAPSAVTAESATPPYYESAEAAKPFPPLVPARYYSRYPLVEQAYRIAAEIPGVLAQQPCYCYCDKVGHRSLLDCYTSDHGAG
jgi:hypothetical protein